MPPTEAPATMTADGTRIACMDVRGGNTATTGRLSLPGLEVWVYSRPYQGDVGGDIYYISACATGRISRVLVADVAGHGESVAGVADHLRRIMQRYINYLDPRQLFDQVNRRFTELSQDGMFATAVITTFFSPTRDLTLCNAGHPPPLLYRRAAGVWTTLDHDPAKLLDGDNLPLGLLDAARYDQVGLQLEVGDLVLCFTDSLPEAQGLDGRNLGQEGLLALVRQLDPAQPQRLIDELVGRLAALSPQGLGGDDVTVLLLQPTGRETQPSLWNRVVAPLRVLGRALTVWRHRGPAAWPEFSVPNLLGPMSDRFNRVWTRRNAGLSRACPVPRDDRQRPER